MLTMLYSRTVRIYKYIVDICRAEDIEIVPQSPIDILLEGTRCIR